MKMLPGLGKCYPAHGTSTNLPEYGFVLQNFWNNANQHVVADPFGMVK